MTLRRLFTFILILFTSIGYAQETGSILFVGNSLTYYNQLPTLVEKAAAQQGFSITTEMIAKPNYAIIDHLNDGEVQKLLAAQEFDYVIVQQGPSSQAEGREMLINDGQKLKQLCDKNGAELCFFMVWPSLNYYSSFSGVIKSHQMAAVSNDAILIPVGEIWKKHFDETKDYSYYGPDGFHPSLKGSKVAADVIIETLFK